MSRKVRESERCRRERGVYRRRDRRSDIYIIHEVKTRPACMYSHIYQSVAYLTHKINSEPPSLNNH